jgi:peptidoglycan pentaglycine glycine transferase (the fourth and fifth glycine)
MMAKENKSDKQMKKIAELDKQIDHDQHEYSLHMHLQNKRQKQGLELGRPFCSIHLHLIIHADHDHYFSGGSSEKYNQFMGPYMMHWFMINYCFDNGYDRYVYAIIFTVFRKIT